MRRQNPLPKNDHDATKPILTYSGEAIVSNIRGGRLALSADREGLNRSAAIRAAVSVWGGAVIVSPPARKHGVSDEDAAAAAGAGVGAPIG